MLSKRTRAIVSVAFLLATVPFLLRLSINGPTIIYDYNVSGTITGFSGFWVAFSNGVESGFPIDTYYGVHPDCGPTCIAESAPRITIAVLNILILLALDILLYMVLIRLINSGVSGKFSSRDKNVRSDNSV